MTTLLDTETVTEVEFDTETVRLLTDAYRHADGSITYIHIDDDCEHVNPRNAAGNVATLIQENTRCIDVDADDADLSEARGRLGYDTEKLHRYLSIFRPDVLYYTDHWSAGDSYGWGYVTREAWDYWMLPPTDQTLTPEQIEKYFDDEQTAVGAREAFDAEVKVYGLWATGEVYGGTHVQLDGTEDTCWGFLGYDDNKQIVGHFTDSPITEVLH